MPWNINDIHRRDRIRGNSAFDLQSVTLKIAIVTNSYIPNQNTHDFWNDVSANEVTGTNYTALGNAIANVLVTLSGAGLVTFDSDDPAAWAQSASGFTTGRRFVLLRDTGVSTTSDVIAYTDAEAADFGNVAGPLTFQISATGIYTSAR